MKPPFSGVKTPTLNGRGWKFADEEGETAGTGSACFLDEACSKKRFPPAGTASAWFFNEALAVPALKKGLPQHHAPSAQTGEGGTGSAWVRLWSEAVRARRGALTLDASTEPRGG